MTLVSFCGIDGAGKSSIISSVKEKLLTEHDGHVSVCKSVQSPSRDLVEKKLRFDNPHSFISGSSAAWYALTSALDFATYLEGITPLILSEPGNLFLFDRYADCFITFASAVSPICRDLVKDLLIDIPEAALTVYVSTSPDLAWQRICSRVGGPSPDESLLMLEHFHAAYQDYFNEREGNIFKVDNRDHFDETVSAVVEEIRTCLR